MDPLGAPSKQLSIEELTVRLNNGHGFCKGYYFTDNFVDRTRPNEILRRIELILENELVYNSNISINSDEISDNPDDDFYNTPLPNEWRGCEIETLLELANVVHDRSRMFCEFGTENLLRRIEQLAAETINARTHTPREIVEARKMGYIGKDKTEAIKFIQEFQFNISFICRNKMHFEFVNVETVIFDYSSGKQVDVLKTIERVHAKIKESDKSLNLVSIFNANPLTNQTLWWSVQLPLLLGIRPSSEMICRDIVRLLKEERFCEVEHILRHYHDFEIVNYVNSNNDFLLNIVPMWLVQALITYGADLNAMSQGRTPIDRAITAEKFMVATDMIDCGGDVNIGNPLILALSQASSTDAFIYYLIKKGVDIDRISALDGNTNALIEAMSHGRESIVRLLVNAGADVNHTNDNGDSALIIALNTAQIDLAEFLIRNGAVLDHKNREFFEDLYSESPRMLAMFVLMKPKKIP